MPASRRSPASRGTGPELRNAAALAVLALACGVVAGCYRSPTDVTVYEPGVYKGAADPLVGKSGQPEHEKALRERFNTAATDR